MRWCEGAPAIPTGQHGSYIPKIPESLSYVNDKRGFPTASQREIAHTNHRPPKGARGTKPGGIGEIAHTDDCLKYQGRYKKERCKNGRRFVHSRYLMWGNRNATVDSVAP